jgi:hypothetical protein
MKRRLATIAAAGTAVLALTGLAACGNADEHPGVEEPAREGLAIPVDGVDYNVFITRQLNPEIQPDVSYYEGEASEGNTLYGVFVQVCNNGDEPAEPIDEFHIRDNQGTEIEQLELPEENVFAYRATELQPGECIPEDGSINQLGPTAGALLVFEMPLETTENRPLELEIEGAEETKAVELDL